MLHLQIDPHSGVPVYRQLMDQITYYAASGALKSGDQLPSIRECARALSVNPTTIVKAYNELQHNGVIEMVQGKGAFVAQPPAAMSRREQGKALRPLARRLAVEAVQMGAPAEVVLGVVQEEMEKVGEGAAADNARVR